MEMATATALRRAMAWLRLMLPRRALLPLLRALLPLRALPPLGAPTPHRVWQGRAAPAMAKRSADARARAASRERRVMNAAIAAAKVASRGGPRPVTRPLPTALVPPTRQANPPWMRRDPGRDRRSRRVPCPASRSLPTCRRGRASHHWKVSRAIRVGLTSAVRTVAATESAVNAIRLPRSPVLTARRTSGATTRAATRLMAPSRRTRAAAAVVAVRG